jgi:arsenite-transporting ATPase
MFNIIIIGVPNLFVMEIEPKMEIPEAMLEGPMSMLKELTESIPGIDEAMGFAEMMKQVQTMNYSCIVVDTAPTGHTLRLLSFPKTMQSAIEKMMMLKNKFSGLITQVAGLMGGGAPPTELITEKLEDMQAVIENINRQFKDPNLTTFVCVCIPEFLSLYETERLVQELSKFEMDVRNIVVNQVLFPYENLVDKEDAGEAAKMDGVIGQCVRKTFARQRMQQKYISQIYDLYEDFHVVQMPLLDNEVRGLVDLKSFSENMICNDKK